MMVQLYSGGGKMYLAGMTNTYSAFLYLFIIRTLTVFCIFRGHHSKFFFEIARKILWVIKSYHVSYLTNCQLTLLKILSSSLQTHNSDQFNWCLPGQCKLFIV